MSAISSAVRRSANAGMDDFVLTSKTSMSRFAIDSSRSFSSMTCTVNVSSLRRRPRMIVPILQSRSSPAD